MAKYKPLFPYFGGKSRIAHIVWSLLGDVDYYVEPFFGGGSVLFLRPSWHKGKIEVVNDNDVFIANFWRAIKNNPQEVAKHANWPVNEADLTARHIWLVKYGLPLLKSKIFGDPDYYDAEIAGWWVWGMCQWIGGGWCSGKGKWTEVDGKLSVKPGASCAASNGMSNITHHGRCVVSISKADKNAAHSKRPHLSHPRGIISAAMNGPYGKFAEEKRNPYIGRSVGDDDIGNFGRSDEEAYENILGAMKFFSNRLRHVMVVCGDWSRVVTRGALSNGGTKGIFLDPPYSKEFRSRSLYNTDDRDISKEVNEWCVENGGKEDYRIVLCGYEGEHNNLEDLGWKKLRWVAARTMGRTHSKDTSRNAVNRFMERIWYSPHCLPYHGGDSWNHPTLW